MTTPAADYASFAEGFVAGQGQVLWRERVADLETPVGAFLKLAAGRPNSFLLESVEGGSARGRYSAIGLDPDLIWRCRGGRAEVNRHALAAPHAFEPEEGDALDSLRRAVAAVRLPLPAGLPPMATGLFGYVRDALTLCTAAWPDRMGADPRAAWEAAQARLDEAEAALDRPLPRPA